MRRWFVLVGITAALALGIGVAVPADAAQAITAAGAPDPLNVLPSVVKGAMSGIGPKQLGNPYSILYSYAIKGPLADYAKIAAQANAAPVPKTPVFSETQLAAKAASKLKFKIPATKFNPIMKGGVGPSAVAMVGYQVGVFAGQGLMEVVGIDEAGSVCGQGKGWEVMQNLITGLDCDAWAKSTSYTANLGTVKRPAGWSSNIFYWGGDASADTWMGVASGTPVGNAGEWKLSVGFVPEKWNVDGGAGTSASSAVQTFCQVQGGPYTGLLVSGSGNVTAGQDQNHTPPPNTFACPLGSLLFAIGRPTGSGGTVIGTWAPNEMGSYGTVARLTGGGSLMYFTPLSPLYKPESDGNPARRFECVVAGSDGTTYTSTTVDFKETDPSWPTPECAPLPEGVLPIDTKINEVGGDEVHEVQAQPTTPEYKDAVTKFPECMDGSCMLDLQKIGVGSCFDHPTDCAGWFQDPNKESTYTCRYNGKVVAFAECTVYAPTFEPAIRGVGDPVTGDPIPEPNPPISTLPGTGTIPSEQRDSCFPSGWGVFNPFEWVMKPVGCALTAAFTPRRSVVEEALGKITARYEASTVGQYAAVLGTFDFTGVSGCQGLAVNMSWIPGAHVATQYYMPACPGDFFGAIAPLFKIFMYGTLAIGGFFGVTRVLGKVFGYTGLGSGA
jgi:hypothetical protein